MNEQMKIVDCFLPSLAAGKYTVAVTQKVKSTQEEGVKVIQEVSKKMNFAIDAARFTLNSDDVFSVYPPSNTTGQYANHFPHVVFNRRTLPWERTIDGKARATNDSNIPWMAIVLLDQDEMRSIRIVPTLISDLLYQEKPSDNISRPKIRNKNAGPETLQLMEWEDQDTKCLTVDLSKEQFIQYIPKRSELPYCAHAKIVNVAHKEGNGISDTLNQSGYFATLVGNRFIQRNKAYTAIVVSLEGHLDYIENNNLMDQKVRMVVLASWKFSSAGETSFESLLKSVEVKSMNVELIQKKTSVLDGFLKQGYTPMRHTMRNGAKNVSWYRGPFVPNKTHFSTGDAITFSSSDTALYYDTNTGLLDVSIAAAWELGKILALKNQEFTKAMIEWNNNPDANVDDNSEVLLGKPQVIEWIKSGKQPGSNLIQKEGLQVFKPFPDTLLSFLKDLASLKGVPFAYLVPDKKYITTASGTGNCLTLFHVHQKWIFALLDGAVSLTGVRLLDTKTQIERIIGDVYGTGICTGFLFNSQLISGWRSIEIKVRNKAGELLTDPIRFERITPSVFLGVFRGSIGSITVIQPFDGLHFGIKNSVGQSYEKKLKPIEESKGNQDKIEIKANDILKDNQVISIERLVAQFEKSFNQTRLSSSNFAFQMVDSPMESTFIINYKSER